ncbi:hypothetical protein SAMN06298226_1979 [Nitrosovibrio sp. Nv4]|nr:hypothetical protein SAMN06298226_1979 [Nitrosovibrio sp. Nv4]
MVKRWLPLIILVICTILSIAALNGLARNIAQKRDVLSDPLCNRLWKKTYHIGHTSHAKDDNKKMRKGLKTSFLEKRFLGEPLATQLTYLRERSGSRYFVVCCDENTLPIPVN